MAIATQPWDVVEFLATEGDIRHYLEAAFEDGDPALIRSALADAVRARGIMALARDTDGRTQ